VTVVGRLASFGTAALRDGWVSHLKVRQVYGLTDYPFHTPDHHLVGHARGIETRLAGHGSARLASGATGHTPFPILRIHVIGKDGSSLDSPIHDMVQSTRRIQARPTWHGKTATSLTACCLGMS
jgi:hypothetical protein